MSFQYILKTYTCISTHTHTHTHTHIYTDLSNDFYNSLFIYLQIYISKKHVLLLNGTLIVYFLFEEVKPLFMMIAILCQYLYIMRLPLSICSAVDA